MIKFISGEENSPGWFCGEDEGKVMARGCCPLLASHMSVFAMKSPDRKVRALPYNTGLRLAYLFNPFNTFGTCLFALHLLFFSHLFLSKCWLKYPLLPFFFLKKRWIAQFKGITLKEFAVKSTHRDGGDSLLLWREDWNLGSQSSTLSSRFGHLLALHGVNVFSTAVQKKNPQ